MQQNACLLANSCADTAFIPKQNSGDFASAQLLAAARPPGAGSAIGVGPSAAVDCADERRAAGTSRIPTTREAEKLGTPSGMRKFRRKALPVSGRLIGEKMIQRV